MESALGGVDGGGGAAGADTAVDTALMVGAAVIGSPVNAEAAEAEDNFAPMVFTSALAASAEATWISTAITTLAARTVTPTFERLTPASVANLRARATVDALS